MKYLDERGVFYKLLDCEKCGGVMRRIGSKLVLRCSACDNERCMRVHTFFHGSKLQCCQILEMAYYWLLGLTKTQISAATKRSAPTVRQFVEHFRNLVNSSLEVEDTIIGGSGIEVQIDETKLGKRKYERGHRVEGVWCVGGVEKTAKRRMFLVPVEKRDESTFREVIKKHVAPGSIITSDCWSGYNFLKSDENYIYKQVNHSKHFKDPITGTNTNTIEGTWFAVKRTIVPRERVKGGMEGRLAAIIWRRKNANNIWEAFLNALVNIHYEF